LIKKPGVIEAALNHSWFSLKWSVNHEFGQIKGGRLAFHEANTIGSRDPGARENKRRKIGYFEITDSAKELDNAEKEIQIDDLVDIGVFTGAGKNGKALFMAKRRITQPEMEFEVTVDQLPARAGIDPYNKLIDRNPDDNIVFVSGGQRRLSHTGGFQNEPTSQQ
jgi:hypothetical protein